jgi:hypothetical protein
MWMACTTAGGFAGRCSAIHNEPLVVQRCPQVIHGSQTVVDAISPFQRLFEHVQRVIHFRILGPFAAYLAYRMQYGRVIATAE